MSDSMDVESLVCRLGRLPAPWTVEVHAQLPSTNNRALQVARPWHVVVTDHQTAGRGRLQRLWQTLAGVALTCSATVPAGAAGGWLPLAAGVAVAQALQELAGLPTVLKWPNDVLVPADGNRKVCGILCEVAAPSEAEPVAVVGIGVNLTQSRQQLPTKDATSVALAGRHVDREALLVGILEFLVPLYAEVAAGGTGANRVRSAYRDRCVTVGSSVRLDRPGGPNVVGVAVAVDDQGRLVVREPTGERTWAAGDVTHLRLHGEGAPGG